MKSMIKSFRDITSCPNCGNDAFIILNRQTNCFLQNYGKIEDCKKTSSISIGKCVKCGSEFEMLERQNSFVPMTKLRKIIYLKSDELPDYCMNNHGESQDINMNPMQKVVRSDDDEN